MYFRYLTTFLFSLLLCDEIAPKTTCFDAAKTLWKGANNIRNGIRAEISKDIRSILTALRRKKPYFYFDPLPRFGKKLDFGLVDSKKEEYLKKLENVLNLANEGGEAPPFAPPTNNEEKLALIEAVTEFVSNNARYSEDFASLLREREREFVRIVGRWNPRKRPLSPERFKKLVDQHYLWTHSSFFRMKNIKGAFRPGKHLAEIARRRWEHEVAKQGALAAMKKLQMIPDVNYTRDVHFDRAKAFLRGTGNLFLNYSSLVTIYLPVFFPKFGLYNFSVVKTKAEAAVANTDVLKAAANFEEAFLEFQRGFKRIETFEFYKDWANLTFPYFIMGAFAFISYGEYQKLQEEQASQAEGEVQIPELTGLETREEIEDWIFLQFNVRYEAILGRPPVSEEQQRFRNHLASLKLSELDSAKVEIEQGNLRPLFQITVEAASGLERP